MTRHTTEEPDSSARIFGIWGAFFALTAIAGLLIVQNDDGAFGFCFLYFGCILTLLLGASSRPSPKSAYSDEPALWPASFLGRRRFIIHAYLMGMVLTVVLGIVTQQTSTIRIAVVALGILLFIFSLDQIFFDTTDKYERESNLRRKRLQSPDAHNAASSKYAKHIPALAMIALMVVQLLFVAIADYGEFVAQLSRWFK